MRKMTKTVAVLAAMSAMTVASASLAFAATDNTAYTSVGKEAVAAGAASGEWGGDDVKGWTFTPAGASKLKGTWAQINNVWYYFNKDGIMAQNELMYLEGETYYFNADGSMMANGWVGFDNDSDVLYDYDLDISENVDDIQNQVFKDKEDAYETVWMYFNADGTAVDDEWLKTDAGLWYYFDDIVMVCGDYDHEINGSFYGFAEDGHMYVGWEKNYNDLMKTAPNKDEETWYYYDTNGKKFEAGHTYGTDDYNYSWKKIDGNWYCFSSIKEAPSVGTLIVNAFFCNTKAGGGSGAYYYVDKKGVMVTDVTEIPDTALYVTADDEWTANFNTKTGKKAEVFFNSKGEAQADKWNGNKFYAKANSSQVKEFTTNVKGVTGYTANTKHIQAALVKSAFVGKNSDAWFYVDKYGEKVVNSAIEVGAMIDGTFTPATEAKSTKETEAANEAPQYKAYVLCDKKGEFYTTDDVDADRTVKIGSKKYIATGTAFADTNMQVFYYDNEN